MILHKLSFQILLYCDLIIGAALCSPSCPVNAGCLGPSDPAFCGSCDLVGGTLDPCAMPPAESNIAVIVGVVASLLGLVVLVLVGLGVWACVVCGRKWKEGRQGSFDISVSGCGVGVWCGVCGYGKVCVLGGGDGALSQRSNPYGLCVFYRTPNCHASFHHH